MQITLLQENLKLSQKLNRSITYLLRSSTPKEPKRKTKQEQSVRVKNIKLKIKPDKTENSLERAIRNYLK